MSVGHSEAACRSGLQPPFAARPVLCLRYLSDTSIAIHAAWTVSSFSARRRGFCGSGGDQRNVEDYIQAAWRKYEINIASLPIEMKTQVPFNLYDPELIAGWVEDVWAQASAAGSASSLGLIWTANTVGEAHEVVTDAHCQMPQTLPFDKYNDDLFKDSDAP